MATSSVPARQPNYDHRLRNVFDAIAPASTSDSFAKKHLPYDVFVSHHGGDVKHSLANTIYKALDSTGLRVFLDKDELKLGDFFPNALEEAMRSASIHIAIFSENYANSPWCLAELAFMMQTVMQTGIKFIPIFYHVEPSALRWAIEGKGSYAGAFHNHEIKGRYSSEQLQIWKYALQQASLYTGEEINNQGDEDKAVTDVVNSVLKDLKEKRLEVAMYPVGLDKLVRDFENTLQSAGRAEIVGIFGMGGMGKTTLAMELYNRKFSTFNRSSFVFDVREAARKGRLHEKQKKLLKDLDLEGKYIDFDNVKEGKEILKSRLRSVPMLIVLDDVDDPDQLNALLPARESLGQGSQIIVTTRHLDVLTASGISTTYEMRPQNPPHAEQLFSWHAFRQPSPLSGFEDLTKSFINACHDLPLSLAVLGSLLYGESSKNIWQSQLNKILSMLPEDTKSKLKISYDALDKTEKDMFLDVACFFIGEKLSLAIEVWDALGWNGLHGWRRLVDKALVGVDQENRISMQNDLRDFGREIASQQAPYRLWSPQQIIQIQPHQEAVPIRGIVNAFGPNCYPRQGKIILNTSQGARSLAPCSLGLKIYVGNGDFITEDCSELSRELVWLRLERFKGKKFPSWLSSKNLRILELLDPWELEDLWHSNNAPSQLRELVIKGARKLEKIENIKSLRSLKMLKIENCSGLYWLPSLAELSSLKNLELENCLKLEKIESLKNLRSLKKLKICDCPNLDGLPSLADLISLKKFVLIRCDILEKIEGLESLRSLKILNIYNCPELTALPSLAKLTILKEIKLKNCYKLEKIEGLETVRSFETLMINDCPKFRFSIVSRF